MKPGNTSMESESPSRARKLPKLEFGGEAGNANISIEQQDDDERRQGDDYGDGDGEVPTTTVPAASKATKVMTNSVVLGKIVKLLPVGCLLNLRETCTRWNLEFIPKVKKEHSQIRLGKRERESAGPSSSSEYLPRKTMKKFVNILQSSQDVPFTQFWYDVDFQGMSRQRRDRDRTFFKQFLSSYGNTSTIKSLEISWVRSTDFSVRELREVIFNLTPQLEELIISPSASSETGIGDRQAIPVRALSKLKKLEVELGEENIQGWLHVNQPYRAITRLVSDVIQAASGLETLDLSDESRNLDFIHSTIGGLFQNAAKRSHIHKLKTLRTSYLPNSDVQILIDLAKVPHGGDGDGYENGGTIALPLRLSSFSTWVLVLTEINEADEVEEAEEGFRLLHTFLTTQSPTLKELEISFQRLASADGIAALALVACRLPQLKQLKKLSLSACGLGSAELLFDGDVQAITGRRFMDTFPKLEHFSYEYDSGIPFVNNVDRFYHSGVKTLEIESQGIAYMGFASFKSVFPSLTRLELNFTSTFDDHGQSRHGIHIDVKEFSKIWTTWPGLETIHICWKPHDLFLDLDTLVTGISRKELELLRYEHKVDYAMETSDLELKPGSLHAVVNKYKRWPAIRDLKCLQELKITFDGENNPRLTDMGGYFGIALASPTLQEVVIRGIEKNLLSKRCLEFIKDTFGPLAIIDL